jgi:hypothetical protein
MRDKMRFAALCGVGVALAFVLPAAAAPLTAVAAPTTKEASVSTSMSGCGSPAGAAACAGLRSAPFVTYAQAWGAIAALWAARERALDSRNISAFGKLETGSARLTDTYAAKEVTCGCNRFYWTRGPRKLFNATIYLPRQHGYPLYFAASVQAHRLGTRVTTTGTTAMLIVTRTNANAPWRIAMEVWDSGYNPPPGRFPPPQLDQQGYDTAARVPPAAATHDWFPKLVSYFNQLKRTGKQPTNSPFAPGPLTSRNGLQKRPNGYTTDGLTSTYAFRAGNLGGPWLFNAGGQPFICGDIFEEVTTKPSTLDHILLQPPKRNNWGPDTPPGYYHAMIAVWEWAVCIYPQGNTLGVGGNTGGGYPVADHGQR